MMTLLYRLLALLAGAALVAGTLPGCATSADVAASLSQPLDTAVQRQAQQQRAHALVLGLTTGRLKFKGPVTIQVSTGNVNAPQARGPLAAAGSQAQDYTRAGQHGGALATAPDAQAGARTRLGVPPWLLVVGVGLLLGLLAAALVYRYRKRLTLLF